jgi:hypothetical protein
MLQNEEQAKKIASLQKEVEQLSNLKLLYETEPDLDGSEMVASATAILGNFFKWKLFDPKITDGKTILDFISALKKNFRVIILIFKKLQKSAYDSDSCIFWLGYTCYLFQSLVRPTSAFSLSASKIPYNAGLLRGKDFEELAETLTHAPADLFLNQLICIAFDIYSILILNLHTVCFVVGCDLL